MLNIYWVPRGSALEVPSDASVARVLAYLTEIEVIGPEQEPGEYPPGLEAAELYNRDAHDQLLPAELTFEALRVVHPGGVRFLPERQRGEDFEQATCRTCGDDVDLAALDKALDRLGYFPPSRFVYVCPSCRTELRLRDVDFGQATAEARFWFVVEGAATSRLNGLMLDHLGRLLGSSLVVVPEIPPEDLDAWMPLRRPRRRR